MNEIALFNLISLGLLLLAMGWIVLYGRKLSKALWIEVPLLLALLSYAFINLSNFLEHCDLTDFFDPIEDIVEILFLVLFLFFILGYRAYMHIREVIEREDWFYSAVNSLDNGIIATDEKGNIHFTNSKMEEMTGVGWKEALAKPVGDLLCFYDKETKKSLDFDPFEMARRQDKADPYPSGVYLKSRNGTMSLVLCHTSPVKDREGKILGMIGSFNDVSSYYSMMEQLNHLQKMKAIGQLTSGIAHDLNNMLGGISGAAELLQSQLENCPDNTSAELMDILSYSVENARELTANLLSFSRKERSVTTTVELGGILRKSTEIAKRTIDKIISIKMILPDGDLYVTGDPAQLQNAFLNLMLNARDAQPQGGEIGILLEKSVLDGDYCRSSGYRITPGNYAVIRICDRGSGIKPEIMDRIFEPFFTTKEKGKGTGLGLTAVNNTVTNHNGAMEIINREKGGCCVNLWFPLADSGTFQDDSVAVAKRKSLKGLSLLIIDDESIIRTTTELLLKTEDISCETAESGQRGLEILSRSPELFDAVIVDLIMPRMGGQETAEKIHELYPNLSVYWMSGYSRNEEIPSYLKGFIRKPFKKEEILQLLADTL